MYIKPFTTVVDWQEIDVSWKYLLCFIFVDTAFLLGTAEFLGVSFLSVFIYITALAKNDNKVFCWLKVIIIFLEISIGYSLLLCFVLFCFFVSGCCQVHASNTAAAPLSKNAVSAFQISCELLSFTLKDSWRNYQMINALP